MRARQREVTEVVIEFGVLPTGRVMTGRAIRAVLSIMLILLPVAGIAVCWRPLEQVVDMAVVTGCLPVFAFKLEAGQVVIEPCRGPAFCGVAVCTV